MEMLENSPLCQAVQIPKLIVVASVFSVVTVLQLAVAIVCVPVHTGLC